MLMQQTEIFNNIKCLIAKENVSEQECLKYIINQLHDFSFDINYAENNETLVDLAAEKGLVDVCQFIILSGQLEQKNLDKALMTCLLAYLKLEATLHTRLYSICELLLKAGAKPKKNVIPNKIFFLLESYFDSGLALLKLFIQYGAEVNTFDQEEGYNLLTKTMQIDSYEHQKQVFKALLEGWINPELTQTGDYETPLMAFASQGNSELCKSLVEYGADITMVDNKGETAVYYAEMSEKMSIKEYFVGELKIRYSDINYDDIDNDESNFLSKGSVSENPLDNDLLYAVLKDDKDDVEKLLNMGANINYVSTIGTTPFSAAVSSPRGSRVLEFFLEKNLINNILNADNENRMALFWPERSENIKLLKKYGFDINIRNHLGETPFYKAVVSGVYADKAKILTAYLDEGADVNAKTNQGQTVLQNASLWNDCDLVEVLLKAGAKVNEPDMYGKTPLHRAAQKEVLDNIKILLESGADPTIKCKLGKTPLDYAYGKEARKLLSDAINEYQEKEKTSSAKKPKTEREEDQKKAVASSSSVVSSSSSFSRPATRSMSAAEGAQPKPKQ